MKIALTILSIKDITSKKLIEELAVNKISYLRHSKLPTGLDLDIKYLVHITEKICKFMIYRKKFLKICLLRHPWPKYRNLMVCWLLIA